MKIYIVFEQLEYSGETSVSGVFANDDDAIEVARKMRRERPQYLYWIEDHEVKESARC